MKKLGIYIHIPFCESKCYYCDFTSGVSNNDVISSYRDAIVREINEFDSTGYIVDTIFIGGGTPTSVSSDIIEDIVLAIRKNFVLSLVEFTIEGNPNSYTKQKLDHYIRMGVDRVSVGVQSLDDKVLKAIGRVHTSSDAKQCLQLLMDSGLKVSADMMVGLPYQTLDIVKRDAKMVMDSGIGHVSCYSLILESGTKLASKVANGELVLPSDDDAVDMYDAVMYIAKGYGLNRYETSNFGVPCQHNVGYWKLKEYAGFGVSAHSFNKGVRYYNTNNLQDYITGNKYIIDEKPTLAELSGEYMMLSLRLDQGVDIEDFKSKYGDMSYNDMMSIAKGQAEYLHIDNRFISIKPEYSYISNSIIEKFI